MSVNSCVYFAPLCLINGKYVFHFNWSHVDCPIIVEKIHKPTTSFGVFVKPLIVWLRCNALLQCCCKVVVVVVVVVIFVRWQNRRQRSWFPVHGRMTITVGVGDSWVKKREFVAVWNISSLSNFPFPIHLPFLFSLSLFLPSFSFTLLLIHSTNSPLPPLLPPPPTLHSPPSSPPLPPPTLYSPLSSPPLPPLPYRFMIL